ncbi:type I restriction-modification system M subunit [Bacteroides sp. CAG:1076]|nr:type I restriction-modification system M subunit [Bacteroides sp. CAG:1076]
MTSTQQRDELHNKIWKIANEVRGAVDGWDFKQFVLGTLFYRYISENFTDYIEGGDDSVNYAELPDSVITPEIKDDAVKTKGYFIYPSQLFVNVVKTANINPNLNTDLKAIFDAIENSAVGYASEKSVVGLFADFDTTSTRLGSTVEEKNSRLAAVLRGIASLDFGKFEDSEIDIFGDSYEFLINNYAANAGKSGGEFFTPQNVSKLISRLAMHNQTRVNKIYDPAAGSGSLLLQAKRQFEDHIIEDGFFGQEINPTTYNLARMNMFLHNINYDKFKIVRGNTLTDPQFGDEKPFDAIVSNPPYSVNWMGSDDPTLINDDRFAPAGVLAPKSKADFAFVLHALHYLSGRGRAAIVCFPGIFYRGGAEQKIRKYLVDGNYVETIISLPSNLFYGTSIAVNILVLSKHKPDTKVQFIDASGEEFYTKEINNNILDDNKHHIDKIIEIFDKKKDIDYIAKSVDNKIIAENDYNLSVSSYIEGKDTRPKTDIKELNERIRCIVARENELRTEIDEVITELIGRGLIMSKLQELIQKLCPDGVKYKKLGEIVVIKNGKDYKHLAQGHIPVYGSGGIMTYVNEYVYNKPTVLIPRKGSLGNLF